MHRRGVHCGFCDGSVRFISDDVAIEAWHAMHTRDRGDALPAQF